MKQIKLKSWRRWTLTTLILVVLVLLGFTIYRYAAGGEVDERFEHYHFTLECNIGDLVTGEDIKVFARALTFKTISFDNREKRDMQPFLEFHCFLEESFPAVHRELKRETINKYSLLYTWTGSDPSLKPVLLAAHIDVVPAPDKELSLWKYEPFAGVIDGKYVWGRGAYDFKAGVIGSLHAVEKLINNGFRPKRTIYLAFGHDEEIGGIEGAREISRLLQKRGVKLAGVLDEGGGVLSPGMLDDINRQIGIIGIAEKGEVNLKLSAQSEGPAAHSSVPPEETPLGIVCQAIARVQENPFTARFTEPTAKFLENISKYLPGLKRFAIKNLWLFGGLVKKTLLKKPMTAAMLRTTAAPTMISGSEKVNAIPGKVEAFINLRILPGETVQSVIETVKKIIDDPRVQVTPLESYRDPSPTTPVPSEFYRLLVDTSRCFFPDATFTPYLVVGGTDSRHYAPLTEQILRFSPLLVTKEDIKGPHGINERLAIADYKKGVYFLYQFIKNADSLDSSLGQPGGN